MSDNYRVKAWCDYQEFALELLKGSKVTKWDKMLREMFKNSSNIRTIESGTMWYKARDHKNENEEPYDKKNIGMNKKGHAEIGRCNKEGQSLFYLSDNIDTTIMEIKTKEKYVSVGKWYTTASKRVADAINFMMTDSKSIFGGFESDYARYFYMLMIENHFTKKEENGINIYPITSHVANILLELDLDGIRYRSVYNENVNIALVSDNDMEWKETTKYYSDNNFYTSTEILTLYPESN